MWSWHSHLTSLQQPLSILGLVSEGEMPNGGQQTWFSGGVCARFCPYLSSSLVLGPERALSVCPFPWIHAPCLPFLLVLCFGNGSCWRSSRSSEQLLALGRAGDVEGGGRKEICDCSEGSRGAGQSRGAVWSCALVPIDAAKPSVHAERSGQGAILGTAHSAGVTWNGT